MAPIDGAGHGSGDISVIIPAYNAAGTIERALASVAAQTLRPLEAIVADDGSDDGTSEIAERWRGRMNGVALKVLRQPRRGAGAARNLALSHAGCALVAFLDADDEWLPEKIEQSLRVLKRGNHVLVAHNGWVFDGDAKIHNDIAAKFAQASGGLFHGLYRRGFISTSSVVARRDAIAQAGGFDETLPAGQDFDLWLKLMDRAEGQFEIFDQDLTHYHVQPGGITSHTKRRLRCGLAIARAHAPALSRHKGSPVLSLWFRIAAIHQESIQADMGKKNYLSVFGSLLSLPIRLVWITLVHMGRKLPGGATE